MIFVILSPILFAGGVIVFFWYLSRHAKGLDRPDVKVECPDFGGVEGELKSTFSVSGQTVQATFLPSRRIQYGRIPPSLMLQIDLPFGSSLFLSKELNGDRLLERLGFSQEAELDNLEIKRCLHIVAEHADLARRLMSNEEARAAMLQIGATPGFEYLEISGTRCRLYFSNMRVITENFSDFSERFSTLLVAVSKAAQATFGIQPSKNSRRFARKFALYESRGLGVLAVFGYAIAVPILFVIPMRYGPPVHLFDAVILIGSVSLLSVLALIGLARSSIRKFQLPSKVLFSVLAGLITYGTTFGLAGGIVLNASLDRDEAHSVRLPVVSKYVWYGSRGQAFYNVAILPPVVPKIPIFSQMEFATNKAEFDELISGRSSVELKVHHGYFGLPWYEFVQFHIGESR